MKTTTKMEMINIEELIPYVNNARTHSEKQINKLRSSLREFGFVNPVLIDSKKNVIAGHGRIAAAKAEGIKKIPCVYVDYLTDAEKKAYILADNRMAMDAGWDEEILKIELESLQDMDFDLSLTGFDDIELEDIFKIDEEATEDDFDVDEELKKPAKTKSGDLWQLGPHRLVCGDATSVETFELLMGDKKANLVVTDPPYNVDYKGKSEKLQNKKIQNDKMENGEFYEFLYRAFVGMENAMAVDSSIYVFHADTEGQNFRRAFSDAGFYLSECCVWVKPTMVLGRSPYQWRHEPCLFGWKKKGKHKWYSDRKQTTVWEFDRPTRSVDHPTMKPLPLLAYVIQNSSMTNSIVLDPFGGSGSTLIASEQTGRICYTSELDEKFCDVIINRYIELTGTGKDVYCIRNGEKRSYSDIFEGGNDEER